jgi:hypothetical protein
MNTEKDPFKNAPEFLAAFENVRKNGFFEEMQYQVGSPMSDGKISHCIFGATGCVPSEQKYAAVGCGALFDPPSIIESCKKLSQTMEVKHVSVEVKTEDWALWDEAEENIIGSKGYRTKMSIFVRFI